MPTSSPRKRSLAAVPDASKESNLVELMKQEIEGRLGQEGITSVAPPVVAAPGAGALDVFPVDGTGSYLPAPGERSVTFNAPGARAVAVKPGRVTFQSDATHGTVASLAADGGWSFVYGGLAAALGVERDVLPGDALGIVGQEAMTFVAVSPTGPVDPLPLFKELHAAPGQPGEDLPQLKVVPLPGRTDPGPVAKVNPPGEVPAPGPVIAKPGLQLGKLPPWMILAGLYVLVSSTKRRR